MEELQLKYIAGYLPYNLKVVYEEHRGLKDYKIKDINAVNVHSGTIEILCNHSYIWTDKFKPILRPITDLNKEINGIVPLAELASKISNLFGIDFIVKHINQYNNIIFSADGMEFGFLDKEFYLLDYGEDIGGIDQLMCFSYLFEHHFDIYGLIDKGLAVDINKFNI